MRCDSAPMRAVRWVLGALILGCGMLVLMYLPIQAVLYVERSTGVILRGQGLVFDQALAATLFGIVLLVEMAILGAVWAYLGAVVKRRGRAQPVQHDSGSGSGRSEFASVSAHSSKAAAPN